MGDDINSLANRDEAIYMRAVSEKVLKDKLNDEQQAT